LNAENNENYVLSWSISSDFGAIHSLLKCASLLEIARNSLKPSISGLKVVQAHRCWHPRKARQQCLLWQAASLCISATVVMLDELIVVK